MAPNPLDCRDLVPFDVLRFPIQFLGDPERVPKLFVVAANYAEVEAIRCFKSTSRTQYYDGDPLKLKGVVVYEAGEVPEFANRTIIDPEHYTIPWGYIQACYRDGEFENLGRLPEDFRARIIAAVNAKAEWQRARKAEFFKWFDPPAQS